MSARPPHRRVAAVTVVAALLLAASVVPSAGAGAGATAASAPTASFADRVVHEQRGDVATVTVRASKPATVNLGSKHNGFWLQIDVGKGKTTLKLDTYKAGESDRYALSQMVWASEGNVKDRRLRTPSIDAPLATAEYRMNVTIQGQERALAALVLEERATHGVTARIAPRATDVTKLNSTDSVRKASSEPWKGSVARDDWLLVHVNASGVRGAVAKSRLDGSGEAGLRVEFVQSNPPLNGQDNEFTGASVRRLFTTPETEGFHLAVDTGDHGIEAGDRYRISFVVRSDSPLADERQNVSTSIRIVERRVEVDGRNADGVVVVENRTALTGKTTLTPGTTINVSARDEDIGPFVVPKEVTVADDRTFRVPFDFSDLEPGREFEFRFPDQKKTVPAAIWSPTTTTTAEPNATTARPTATATTVPTTTTTTRTTTTTVPTTTTAEGLTQVSDDATKAALTQQALRDENESDGGSDEESAGPVPGFGPVAAVVAAVAAGLLAVRRR